MKETKVELSSFFILDDFKEYNNIDRGGIDIIFFVIVRYSSILVATATF
jgi:hypothetical protein